MKIRVLSFTMLGSKSGEGQSGNQAMNQSSGPSSPASVQQGQMDQEEDDLPF